MTFTLLIIGILILIPVVIGIAYVAKGSKRQREVPSGAPSPPKKVDPVPLDRNPEMPHRPGATS